MKLVVREKSLVLEDSGLKVFESMPYNRWTRSAGSEDDLVLGFAADVASHQIDIKLGKVRLLAMITGCARCRTASQLPSPHAAQLHCRPHCYCFAQVACTRYLSCARKKLWWMIPEWGSSMSTMPTETQFLLLEHARGGPYTVVLPLLDGAFRATLKADRDLCALARTTAYVRACAAHSAHVTQYTACCTGTPVQHSFLDALQHVGQQARHVMVLHIVHLEHLG